MPPSIFRTKLLLLLIIFSVFFLTSVNGTSNDCAQRCSRLLSRSLKHINYSVQKVENLFKTANVVDFGKICWKFYDFADCEKQCEKNPHRTSDISARLEMLKNLVLKRCKFMDREYSQDIKCIHKYHSFLEIRCSSYLNEAVKLRKNIKENKKAKVQETCRFLHYHNTCLSNTVFFYCPAAKKFFNRFTLRDYFLSFIIPDDDEQFSDEFLDYCQIFDFHKIAKDVYDTTSSIKSEEYNESGERRITSTTTTTTSIPIVKLLDDSDEIPSNKNDNEKSKKVFSSQEDLKETPPDFFYSSARFETTTYRTTFDDKSSTESNYWSPKPVSIDFVSFPVSELSPHPAASTPSPPFTINPNQLLSTIFKIPEFFPTVALSSPDAMTESAKTNLGDNVELLSPTFSSSSSEEDEGDNFFEDHQTTWITKSATPKNAENIMPSKNKSLETNKTKPKPILTSTSKPSITTTTTPDKSPKLVNASNDTIVKLLGSYEVAKNSSSEIIFADHSFPNETKSGMPKMPTKAAPTQIIKPTFKSPNSTKKNQSDNVYQNYRKFSSKENAKPFLSGTKIHIIPIQHYSKESEEEVEIPNKTKSSPKNLVKANKTSSENRDELEKSNEDNLLLLPISPQFELYDDDATPNPSDTPMPDPTKINQEEIEIFDLSSLKWIIIGYFLLFITALAIIVYLLIAIITKKCRRKTYRISEYN